MSTVEEKPAAGSGSSQTASSIDKQFLYGRYQAGEDRRTKLALKMAHKALDIPDDEMNIDARKYERKTGLGALGLAGVALASGAAPLALAAAMWFGGRAKPPVAPPVAVPAEKPMQPAPAPTPKQQKIGVDYDAELLPRK